MDVELATEIVFENKGRGYFRSRLLTPNQWSWLETGSPSILLPGPLENEAYLSQRACENRQVVEGYDCVEVIMRPSLLFDQRVNAPASIQPYLDTLRQKRRVEIHDVFSCHSPPSASPPAEECGIEPHNGSAILIL